MQVTCYYKETCLSCYLQNHHNGDDELLIGITPCGQTPEEAVEELLSEVSESDKVPETIADEDIRVALAEAIRGVDFRWIDEHGDRQDEQPEEDDSCGESSYVWFVLEWEDD